MLDYFFRLWFELYSRRTEPSKLLSLRDLDSLRAYFTLVIFHKFTSGTFTGIIIRRFLDLLREISRANFFPMASSDFHLPRTPKKFFYEIEHTFLDSSLECTFYGFSDFAFSKFQRNFSDVFFGSSLIQAKLKETPKTAIFGIEVFNI